MTEEPVRVRTDRSTFERLAAGASPGARVPIEVRVDVTDPFVAYRRARDGGVAALLETTGGQSGWNYFGVDPVDRLTVGADAVARDGDRSPSLAAVEGLVDGQTLVRGDCDVPYPCGAVGWLSYDVAREIESLPDRTRDDRGVPRAQMAVFDRLAAWKAETAADGDDTTTLRVTACPTVAEGYEAGRERALDLARRARDGDPGVGAAPAEADRIAFESDCGRAAFADRVRDIRRAIRDGETFQTNVSQRLVAPAGVHPVVAYGAVREVNPAPYSALLEFPGVDLVSASPELLLDVDGDRLRTEPIAGTRPRGDDADADAALERDLLADDKERAEHAMLVDLERNDLGKVCEYGSVAVEEYRRVDRYAEVMHLVSSVVGRRLDEAGLADAVAAVFPGGTITGAPKPRTMELIERVEATRRGPYTGSIGIFGFDERATLNIVIRTLVRTGDRYALRVGAGIVHDSRPDREFEETMDKARGLVRAVDAALDDERLAVARPDALQGEREESTGDDVTDGATRGDATDAATGDDEAGRNAARGTGGDAPDDPGGERER